MAAVLFKVEYTIRNGYTSATSSLCRWNQVFSKKVCREMIQYVLAVNSSPLQHEPSRIVDIDFVQPKRGRESLDELKNPSKRPKIFIETLQALSLNSAILSVTTLRHGAQSNTSVARSLLPTITSLGHPRYKQLTENELYDKCDISTWPESLTGSSISF